MLWGGRGTPRRDLTRWLRIGQPLGRGAGAFDPRRAGRMLTPSSSKLSCRVLDVLILGHHEQVEPVLGELPCELKADAARSPVTRASWRSEEGIMSRCFATRSSPTPP